MNDKLLYLKNILGQVDELSLKQKELQQAKNQIHLTGNLELRGEMTIGNLTIPLNDLSKDTPSSISSNLKMVLGQYVEHLIQKNNQIQQDLLSNVQIAHIQETPSSITSSESLPVYADFKKNFDKSDILDVKPFTSKEDVDSNVHTSKTDELPKENKEITKGKDNEDTTEVHLLFQEDIQSRIDQANYIDQIRKLIANEFYSFDKGDYISPDKIQLRIKEKTGNEIEIDVINDVAWALIAQDVIKFVYHAHCDNNHEEYLLPPLPKTVKCSVCKKDILNVNVSYKKLI